MADIGQTNNERRSSESTPAQKRYLKARYVFRALRKRSGRLLIASIIFALIITGLARIQHQFVHSQVYRTTSQELASGAEQLASDNTKH